MVRLYKNFNVSKNHKGAIILIGNFDGVHLGHQKLFKLANSYKKKYNFKIGVINFDPMPKMFFNKSLKNFRLSSIDQKVNLLNNLGVDFIITKKFDKIFFIKLIDFVFEKILLNFFVIIKSTPRLFNKFNFWLMLDNLKFFNDLLKNIFGIGSKLITPIFKLYFFLYDLAKLNNF